MHSHVRGLLYRYCGRADGPLNLFRFVSGKAAVTPFFVGYADVSAGHMWLKITAHYISASVETIELAPAQISR